MFQKRSFYGDPTYNPFERPSMPLASLGLDGSGANNDAGEPVTPELGLAIPTAYRCLAILTTVVASCTLEEITRTTGDADRWAVLDNLASYTAFEIMEIIGGHIGGWGNFVAREVYADLPRTGRSLIDLVPINPASVTIKRVKGKKTYRIKKDADTVTPGGIEYETIIDRPGCGIFHIPGFGFDGLKGQSPIMMAAQTFGTTAAADRLAAKFYSSGQQLGGVIKVKVPLADQSQADAIKYQWGTAHAGVGNAGGVAVLDSETDFQPLTIAPEALQFLQSRQWQASEIAKMFGLPAFMISEQTTWGEGIEQQWQGFIAMTLRSYTDRIEQRFTRQYSPPGAYLEFDLDRLMRGSTMERFQAYGQAIGWGWMTRAEVRVKERMKAVDPKYGLDEPLTPQVMNGALADGPMAAAGGNKPNGAQAAGAAPTGPDKDPQEQSK